MTIPNENKWKETNANATVSASHSTRHSYRHMFTLQTPHMIWITFLFSFGLHPYPRDGGQDLAVSPLSEGSAWNCISARRGYVLLGLLFFLYIYARFILSWSGSYIRVELRFHVPLCIICDFMAGKVRFSFF